MSKDKARVFISYSEKDALWADSLQRALHSQHITYLSDQRMRLGDNWMQEIESALQSCSVFVLLISPDFMASRWAMLEIGVALTRARQSEVAIVPVILQPSDLPESIQRLQQIDARSLSPEEVATHIAEVVEARGKNSVQREAPRLKVRPRTSKLSRSGQDRVLYPDAIDIQQETTGMKKRGRIAFISTPAYRESSPDTARDFIYQNMYTLCTSFDVLSEGRTYDFVEDALNAKLSPTAERAIASDMNVRTLSRDTLVTWRQAITKGIHSLRIGVQGMIELTYELVEGRLDAVIHFTDWNDVTGKPASMVLRREANVHNVPIASDIGSAKRAVTTWKKKLIEAAEKPIFPRRMPPKQLPLKGLTQSNRVLALIAHDAMKLEMCSFFVEHATRIFREYDFILATGTTGSWLRRFAIASGRSERDADKIRCCLSGPQGGDVQIAAAVVKGLCAKVVFFQDPFTSHAHETDIRLFEQAILLSVERGESASLLAELATNVESAKAIIGV